MSFSPWELLSHAWPLIAVDPVISTSAPEPGILGDRNVIFP